MWDIKEIIKNKNIIEEELSKCDNKDELEVLKYSLIANICLIDNCSFKYNKVYKLVDRITSNKKISDISYNNITKLDNYISDEYFNFLLELCENIYNKEIIIPETELEYIITSPIDLVKKSLDFYLYLDKELYNKAKILLKDSTSIYLAKNNVKGMEDFLGITFNDYYFNKAYIKVCIKNLVVDYQTFNHEVMHGIDFYMLHKIPSKNYYGFHEVPTYTIDYLFLNYLEDNYFSKEQIDLLRNIKDSYLVELAYNTLSEIKKTRKKELLTYETMKQLLEVESGIIAYGIYKELNENQENGLSNLKKFMTTLIPIDKKPDFSFINLSDKKILELSKEIGTYSK